METFYYDILDTKTGKIVWQNGNNACFAEYTNGGHKTMFNKEHFLRIYFPKAYVKIDESLLSRWSKYLSLISMSVKMKSVEELNRKAVKVRPYGSVVTLQGKGYIFDFDMAKYRSPGHLKFALHIWRQCYEEGLEKTLKEAFRLKDEYPKLSLFELMQFAHIKVNPYSGHNIVYSGNHYVINIKSAKELKTLIKTNDENFITNNQINNFFTNLSYDNTCLMLKDFDPEQKIRANPILYKKKINEWKRKHPPIR